MAEYRNRLHGAVVEAVRFDPEGEHWQDLPRGVGAADRDGARAYFAVHEQRLYVVEPGDWVVREGRGEAFPMSPEQFEMTFEPVAEAV